MARDYEHITTPRRWWARRAYQTHQGAVCHHHKEWGEGVEDGPIYCEHPREAADVLPVIVNLWMAPLFSPIASEEGLAVHVEIFLKVARALGMDLVDWELIDPSRVIRDVWVPFSGRGEQDASKALGSREETAGGAREMQPGIGGGNRWTPVS